MIDYDLDNILESFKRKVSRLGIDLDRTSKYYLFLTYFKARKFFPDSEITVEISSSGKGFHILIEKEMTILENILWRVRLQDDDRRLIYSIRKFSQSPSIPFFDLIFTEKKGKPVKVIDIEKFLSENQELTDTILNNWGGEISLNAIRELSDKWDFNIERYWTTAIGFKNTKKESIEKTMEEISIKDESFKWKIFPNFLQHGYVLIVYSENMDLAHKRGTWLVNKVDELKNHKYWVRKI